MLVANAFEAARFQREVDAMADLMLVAATMGIDGDAAAFAAETLAEIRGIDLVEAIARVSARLLACNADGWRRRPIFYRVH